MEWVSTSPVFQNVRHSGPPKRFARFEIDPIKTTTIGNEITKVVELFHRPNPTLDDINKFFPKDKV